MTVKGRYLAWYRASSMSKDNVKRRSGIQYLNLPIRDACTGNDHLL
jgi:hypothetical protein